MQVSRILDNKWAKGKRKREDKLRNRPLTTEKKQRVTRGEVVKGTDGKKTNKQTSTSNPETLCQLYSNKKIKIKKHTEKNI